MLSSHPQISGLEGTGVPMDEGQHLQSVYPIARKLGGPGRFGFDERSHQTEATPEVSAQAREALMSAWRPYWDMTKPFLLEKSPPNLLRMRFLQGVFPEARFIVVVRHPVPVTLATRRMLPRIYRIKASRQTALRHWATCHQLLLEDAPCIRNLFVLRYEDMVAAPAQVLGQAATFLGLDGDLDVTRIQSGRSEDYFSRWEATGWTIDASEARAAARFGYETQHPWRNLPVSPEVEALMRVKAPD